MIFSHHHSECTLKYRNPTPTVDVVVYRQDEALCTLEVLLIERANPPYGWALPGGFVDEWEMLETAAIREVQEETGLDITLDTLLYVYSNPARDPRQHTLSVVFTAAVSSNTVATPIAGDDAKEALFFNVQSLPKLTFDHAEILEDFLQWLKTGKRPNPMQKCSAEKS